MEIKKQLKKRLFHPLIAGILAFAAFAVFGYFVYSAAQTYFAKEAEPVPFGYSIHENTYSYSDIKMVEKPFAKKGNVRYYFALDNNGGLLIIALTERDFESKLQGLYDYSSSASGGSPEAVRLVGYAEAIGSELYATAKQAWGSDAFDNYFGSLYLDCVADPNLNRLFFDLGCAAAAFFVFIISLTSIIKRAIAFKRSFKNIALKSMARTALDELEENAKFSGNGDALATDNFLFFPKQAIFCTYSDVELAYRKMKKSLFSSVPKIDFIVALADGTRLSAITIDAGSLAEDAINSIMDRIIIANPGVLIGQTKQNENEYKKRIG